MIPFHPLLFALYAPLALLAVNILQVRPADSIRSILVCSLLGGVVYLAARLVLKEWHRAAAISSVLILLFISYGQVYGALHPAGARGNPLGRHRYLAPAWMVIGGLAFWGVSRRRQNLQAVSNAANMASLVLVVLPLYEIATNYVLTARNEKANAASVFEISANGPSDQTAKPDVYYIVLDMYGRDDVLLDRFQYDNSEFLKQLENLGFTVTRCSVSNYNLTELSLASSFNMNYLDAIGSQYTAGHKNRSGLTSLIHHSAVRTIFERMGYRFINFETGFTSTEIRDADEFLAPSYRDPRTGRRAIRLNAFESLLVKTTAFVIVSDAQTKWLHPLTDVLDITRAHVNRELYLLDKLPTLAKERSPKFVYAHVLIPHDPFVFNKDGVNLERPSSHGPNGAGSSADNYAVGYRNQLDYINGRLIPILDEIIHKSNAPPVIIVQGDHGVNPSRSLILNAYYLPGEHGDAVWQGISPVNSFRVVLNTYFQGKYEILPDVNYASKPNTPFDYEVIRNRRSCAQESAEDRH